MERIEAQCRVGTRGERGFCDPFGGIGGDQPDPGGSSRAQQIEELLQGLAVVTGCCPYQPAAVMVHDHHQVLVASAVGDLVDPDTDQPVEGICLLYTSDAADDLLCVDLGG